MNKNYQLRDKIIFGNDIPKYSDICHFDNLTLEKLKQLIKYDFIKLNECQNDSPTTYEILQFLTKYANYTAHGYVVTINRKDYRTTLEGIEKNAGFDSIQEKNDFYKLFSDADELIVQNNYIYCWYD